MPNTLADVLRAGVRERERTGVRPVLKVGMDHTSTALDDLPDDLLRKINDKTSYCNGPHFEVYWVKMEGIFMFAIRGFRRGKPSETVERIRDALDGYVAALFKEETGRDIVWRHHFSPSERNPTGNGTNWVSKTFQCADISFDLCKEWAHLATNRMIHDLGYLLDSSSEIAPDLKEEWRFQSLHIDFDICTQQSKRLDLVVRWLGLGLGLVTFVKNSDIHTL
jgi:hypothetical protein